VLLELANFLTGAKGGKRHVKQTMIDFGSPSEWPERENFVLIG